MDLHALLLYVQAGLSTTHATMAWSSRGALGSDRRAVLPKVAGDLAPNNAYTASHTRLEQPHYIF